MADFTNSIYQDRRIASKFIMYTIQYYCVCIVFFADRYQPGYGQGGLLYTYQMDEDISEFQLVDTSKPQKVSTYKNKQKIQVYIQPYHGVHKYNLHFLLSVYSGIYDVIERRGKNVSLLEHNPAKQGQGEICKSMEWVIIMCFRDRQRQQRKLEKQMGRRFHRPVQVCVRVFVCVYADVVI